jgi:hypothetical protein
MRLLLLALCGLAEAQDLTVFGPGFLGPDPADPVALGDTACSPSDITASVSCCGVKREYTTAMAAAGCGRTAQLNLELLRGNLTSVGRNTTLLNDVLERACGSATCGAARDAVLASYSVRPVYDKGCVAAAAFLADISMICLRGGNTTGPAAGNSSRLCYPLLAKLPRGETATLAAVQQVAEELGSSSGLDKDVGAGVRRLQVRPPVTVPPAPIGGLTATGQWLSQGDLNFLCQSSCAGTVTSIFSRIAAMGAQPYSTAGPATIPARDTLAALHMVCVRDPQDRAYCLTKQAPTDMPPPMRLPPPPIMAPPAPFRALQGGGGQPPGPQPPEPGPTFRGGAAVEASILRSIANFIGVPSMPSVPTGCALDGSCNATTTRTVRGVLASDLVPASMCTLCGRVQNTNRMMVIVDRARATLGGFTVASVAINSTSESAGSALAAAALRNITDDAIIQLAVYERLQAWACGRPGSAVTGATAARECTAFVNDVAVSARNRRNGLLVNPEIIAARELLLACEPLFIAAVSGTALPSTCSPVCSSSLGAIRRLLGCCSGYVLAALLGPALAIERVLAQVNPSSAMAILMRPLLRSLAQSGKAPEDLFLYKALVSTCALSVAPCEAMVPSTMVSRVAGLNYTWVTAGPASLGRKAAFIDAYQRDLASATFLPARLFNVTALAAGSVVVFTRVTGPSTEYAARAVLAATLALSSPSFAFTSTLTLIEQDRAAALGYNSSANTTVGGIVTGSGNTLVSGSDSVSVPTDDTSLGKEPDLTAVIAGAIVGALAAAFCLSGFAIARVQRRLRDGRPGRKDYLAALAAQRAPPSADVERDLCARPALASNPIRQAIADQAAAEPRRGSKVMPLTRIVFGDEMGTSRVPTGPTRVAYGPSQL